MVYKFFLVFFCILSTLKFIFVKLNDKIFENQVTAWNSYFMACFLYVRLYIISIFPKYHEGMQV